MDSQSFFSTYIDIDKTFVGLYNEVLIMGIMK